MRTSRSRQESRWTPRTGFLAATILSLCLPTVPAFGVDDQPPYEEPAPAPEKPPVAPDLAPGPVFGAATSPTYLFPAKGEDLDEGAYWQVNGHSGGHKRDLGAIRFKPGSGTWTALRPDSAGLPSDERRLIWDVPVYAMADGEVLTCWRNAPDGPDPGGDGCDGTCDDFPTCSCTTPAGGNHVRIVTDDHRMLLHAHFRKGSVPSEICPHNEVGVADWKDKSGPFGFNPDIVVPANQRVAVKAGDLIGHVGNSGKSGGPHLHIHLEKCNDQLRNCKPAVLRLENALVAQRPQGRDVRDDEWKFLDGPLSVTTPPQLVLPRTTIGGFTPPDPLDRIEIEQLTQDAEVTIVVDAVNPAAPVEDFEWERVAPPLNQLRADASILWKVTVSCSEGVDRVSIRVAGFTGTQEASGQSGISGELFVQSFAAESLEKYCIDWAEEVASSAFCNQAPESCAMQETFELTGGETPSLTDDVLEIELFCEDGSSLQATGMPELSLRCGAVPFGFPN